jgi:hypothetical protein
MSMSSELDVPRHMRSPGDDGYRTPTIEDAERALSILGVVDSRPPSQAHAVHSTALESVLQRLPSRATDRAHKEKEKTNPKCLDHDYDLYRTTTDASASTLSWKKRIRHVTWAYFTSTMATGGLANVLYQGKHTARC